MATSGMAASGLSRKHASLEGQFTRSASRDYWLAKIRRNIARDLTNTGALLDKGWKVARFWESDVIRDPQRASKILNRRIANPMPDR